MSFTRTKYDSCEQLSSCNIPRGTGEYVLDINRFENTSTCNINTNADINFYNSDIQNRIDIENELFALNQQSGNCTTNKPTLCMANSSQKICRQKPAVKTICDRSILCGNLSNPNSTNCFGLNAGLNCTIPNSELLR